MGAEKEGGQGGEGTARCSAERQIMAAARDVWSFSMSLLRWREGDYGLYGAMKPYITQLSPRVPRCVCVRRLTVSQISKLNVKLSL